MNWFTTLLSAFGIDAYTVRARVQPAMLVVLPLALCVVLLDPSKLLWGKIGWTLVAWAGGTMLLSQLGRDWGKKKEVALFRSWGGKPTTRALQYRDNQNLTLLQNRRKKLASLLPNIHLPTTEEETRDLAKADEVYDAVATQLRNWTRDKQGFPLVFEENCNYGFRRNLWGMKTLGVASCIASAGFVAGQIIFFYSAETLLPALCTGVFCIILLSLWLLLIRPSWVRIPAEAYADRLLESLDTLK